MIGNSNNLLRLQKHFKKMFAGVHSLIINENDPTLIDGVQSKEGEQVQFFNSISIKQYPKINDWLTRIEKEISLTLANLLAQAISQLITIQSNLNDKQAFINWLDQYQVCIDNDLKEDLCSVLLFLFSEKLFSNSFIKIS